MIGNGWFSPYHQYHSYLTFAYETGILLRGSDESVEAEEEWRKCEVELGRQVEKNKERVTRVGDPARVEVLIPVCEGLTGAGMKGMKVKS